MMDDEEQPAETPNSRRSLKDAWRVWIPRAILEAGLIVFSLLLALGLSDWQEQRHIDHDVAEARQALIEEMQANRRLLIADAHIGHHWRLQANLQRALNTTDDLPELRQAALSLYQTGIGLPGLRDTAWRTATTTGIVQHMDRDELVVLTDVYSNQDALTRSITAYYPHLLQLPHYANDTEQLQGAMVSVMMFLGDMTATEQAIIARQTEALVALGAEEPGEFTPPQRPAG